VYRKKRERDFRKEKEFFGRKSIVAIAFAVVDYAFGVDVVLTKCFES
jgi:hypothetical protein